MATISHKARGFTLVETVLYLGLFSVVTLLVFTGLSSAMRVFSDLRASRDINDTAVRAMERMTRDLSNGLSIDYVNSTFSVNPGRLTIRTRTASGTLSTMEYIATSSQLRMVENGVDLGELTSAKTEVESLIFRSMQSGQVHGVRIELWLRSSYGSVTKSQYFYNTAIVRGTY